MRLTAGTLCLLLLLPTVAAANTLVDTHQHVTGAHENRMGTHEKYRIPFEVKEAQLQSWAEKYTPEKAAEWETVLQERRQLHEKWMSDEMKPKREAWKKEHEARITEIKTLRAQLEAGKMTKEQFLTRAKEIMHRGGAGNMKGHAIYPRLAAAAEKGDAEQASLLLNEMLVFFKAHNERMAEKMK